MPKVKSTLSCSLRQWISPHNKETEILITNGKSITCILCGNKELICKKKYHVDSHCASASHIAAAHRSQRDKLKQATLPTVCTSAVNKNTFNEDLCKALLCANIPLWKLTNPAFKSFLEKYTGKHVPEESTLRKNYVHGVYSRTMDEVRKCVGDNFTYIVVDETTDIRGNYIAHLLIGILTHSEAGKSFLIASSALEKTNSSTICTFVNDSLVRFYEGRPFSTKVLLFVSDAAPYMIRAGKNLKSLFTSLIHVTCVAHGIHRIAEKVREIFPNVNKLISCSRKIFLKCPARISVYKEKMNCPLPPDVVVTRWGTWITAALFFTQHFENYKSVIEDLPADSKHTHKIKRLLESSTTLAADLAFISSNLAFLPDVLDKVQSSGLSLHQQIQLVEDARSRIAAIPGARGDTLKLKAEQVFSKNEGYLTLRQLNDAMVHGTSTVPEMMTTNPAILSQFKYAPIVSVDVERSFSEYKLILTDRRTGFIQDNVEKHLICMHNAKLL